MKTKHLNSLLFRAIEDPVLHQGLQALRSGADEEDVLVSLIQAYSKEREKLVKMALAGEMRRPIHFHFNGLELRRDDG